MNTKNTHIYRGGADILLLKQTIFLSSDEQNAYYLPILFRQYILIYFMMGV